MMRRWLLQLGIIGLILGLLTGTPVGHTSAIAAAESANTVFPPPSIFVVPTALAGGKPSFGGWDSSTPVGPVNDYGYLIEDSTYGDIDQDGYTADTYTSPAKALQVAAHVRTGQESGRPIRIAPTPVRHEWGAVNGDGVHIVGVAKNILITVDMYAPDPAPSGIQVATRRAVSIANALIVRVIAYRPPAPATRNKALFGLLRSIYATATPGVTAFSHLADAYNGYMHGTKPASAVDALIPPANTACLDAAPTLRDSTTRERLPDVLKPYATVAQIATDWTDALDNYLEIVQVIPLVVDQGQTLYEPQIVNLSAEGNQSIQTAENLTTALLKAWHA